MNKRIKMVKVSVIILIFSMIIAGCTTKKDSDDYHGMYPELYSIAIHSLPGSIGFNYAGEISYDSEITVMERDKYGRKLFLYFEDSVISTYSLIISQKSDSEYTYFYPDYNFISSSKDNFTAEEIEELKRKNDWNLEINTDKSVKVEIVRKKKKNGPVKNGKLLELYKKALGEDARDRISSISFFIMDDYNRSIYLGYGKISNRPQRRHVIMLFQPDGSYDESKCLMELTDLYEYQDELKNFKDLNDWNKPLEPFEQ